jgi:hypothetical protein
LAPPIRAAGFNSDVTVRFDTDHLSALAVGAIPKIPLLEIRPRMTAASPARAAAEIQHLSETISRLLGS